MILCRVGPLHLSWVPIKRKLKNHQIWFQLMKVPFISSPLVDQPMYFRVQLSDNQDQ